VSAPANARRRPGRPRSAEAHEAILAAALELAVEGGLARMTMEKVAARAGAGKATIYRRWDTKQALMADALRSIAADIRAPDTGSLRGDFLGLAAQALGANAPGALRLMPRLMSEAAEDPELFAVCRAVLVDPRRAQLREILRRGVERGELRADVDLELAIDGLIGPIVYRVLITGGDPAELAGLAERVFDQVLAGLAPVS
jgi:AcrR family transcriptional regulator